MRIQDIIIKKRDGYELNQNEISFIIKEYCSENIPDYQISSLLMAIYFQGMSFNETAFLTKAMIESGDTLDFSFIDSIKVDKHSTGGVGDKVSILLAPIVASCNVYVPMMSGRGLGHTGGTLDKLESIDGYNVFFEDFSIIKKIILECKYVMFGQTKNIVPADKKLYSLRDVTGTVESIPLITSSIMSKKFAEGTDALVMDIKCGLGAFMKDFDNAKKLALSIIKTCQILNKKVITLITNMNQPLGYSIGNKIEILEVYNILKNKDINNPLNKDLIELTFEIAKKMLFLAKITDNENEAYDLIIDSIKSNKAYDFFLKNVELQGGNIKSIEKNIETNYCYDLIADKDGFIEKLDAYLFGLISMITGAGRKTIDDKIDFNCGIQLFKKVGFSVKKGDLIAKIFYNDNNIIDEVKYLVNKAIVIGSQKKEKEKIIFEELY